MKHFSYERKLQTFLLFGLIALTLSLLSGCEEYEEAAEPTATWIVSDGFAIDLEYSDDEMFEFDIELYLKKNASHLLPYAEMISQSAAEKKISPRLLIALMEQQSGAIRNPDFFDAQPMGDLSPEIGFFEQLRDVSKRIRDALTVEYALGELSAPQKAIGTVLPEGDLEQLREIYQRLFPGVVSRRRMVTLSSAQAIDLQFPYPIGQKWVFGGAHSDDGSGSMMSSLDFMTGLEDWGDPVVQNVVAAAPGRVKVHSSCYVDIVHEGGWSTGYYHLDKIMVKTGDMVVANQPIAKYANNRKQAICMGGSSSGPHVHWTLMQNGRAASLSQKVLSGWTVHPGNFNYDDNCSRMYLTRVGEKTCPWKRLINEGISGASDQCPSDPAKTEPGQCGCGNSDADTDKDGVADCIDKCANDPNKTQPGRCGCNSPETCDGDGKGLTGTYFNNSDFTVPVLERMENIDFNWGSGSPDTKIDPNTFSVRWTGFVEINTSATYTFHTVSDDGVRLWVNNKLLIDNWTNHPSTENQGTISLQGGTSYPIKLEYYENSGGAMIKLLWSSPSQAKQIIPRAKLLTQDLCPDDPFKTDPGECGCGRDEGTCTVTEKLYEAESRTAESGCAIAKNYTGFTGAGFMDFGGNGTWIEWNNIAAPGEGYYTLTFRYANGGANNRQVAVVVNGREAANVSFATTGNWGTWEEESLTVSLKSGNNTIRLRANTGSGGPNLDHMIVAGESSIDNCPSDPDKTEPGQCGCGVPEGSCDNCTNKLLPRDRLYAGEHICSENGEYRFGLTDEGEMALWSDNDTIWSAGSFGPDATLAMQADGNLVVYVNGKASWASRTAGKAGALLILENNGVVSMEYNGFIIWSAGN